MSKNAMAAELLTGLEPEQKEQKPTKAKPRRKSYIDRPGDTLPEKPKRTRRHKDPAHKKTHSFTLLMTEKMYEDFKRIAEAQGLSMNGIATRLIKKYVALHDIDQEDLGI